MMLGVAARRDRVPDGGQADSSRGRARAAGATGVGVRPRHPPGRVARPRAVSCRPRAREIRRGRRRHRVDPRPPTFPRVGGRSMSGRRGRASGRTMVAEALARGDHRPMPHVATSPADLLSVIHDAAHLDGDLLLIDDEAAFRETAIRDLAWTAAFSTDDADDRHRPVARLGGQPGARRPVGEHPGPVRRPRSRRGLGLHRAGHQPPRPDVRHGAHRLRDGQGRRRLGGHPRARPERADLHVPAPDRLLDRRAGGRDRGRLAGPGLHPGRPLPVQRQEVRGRPRGDDRGDPAGLPAGRRGRLPQHRHRLVDDRRPLEADDRRAAARELPSRGRADRAHPDARGGRRDDQRRRRDRRGRHQELDGRGAARLPRRLPARARDARRRAPSASAR